MNNKYENILTVHFPTLPPSVNEIYAGTEKKRVVKHMDNMTVGEIIKYWKEEAVSIVKKEMEKQGIKRNINGVFRIDIGVSPRRATSRYDIDNYLKMPIDALERAGLFKDDVAVVEVFATRLPLGSGVIMSVFKIKDRFIYEDKEKNKECFIRNTTKKYKPKTINEKIEAFVNSSMAPNPFIRLGLMRDKIYRDNGFYVDYILDGIRSKEYIKAKNNSELIKELQNRKINRERLTKQNCKFQLLQIKNMSYLQFCNMV